MEGIIIHKSHTKAYLIKIIQLLKLPLKYNQLTKPQLLEAFDYWCLENYDFEFTDNHLEIKNCEVLMEYLSLPAQKDFDYKSVKDKQLLQLKARQLICYVNNGCDIERSFYKSSTEIHDDAILLAQQGHEVPSCRRAVFKYNTTIPPHKQINLPTKKYTFEEMKIKLKQNSMKEPIFKKREGKFTITF
tara:strand:- start:3252 stop:3815 length:564 start_codon:yes stop_codon:yes gene_type:complete